MGEAAELLGTPRETLRRWEETGEWLPARKTHPACGGDSLSQPKLEQDFQEYQDFQDEAGLASRIFKMKQDLQDMSRIYKMKQDFQDFQDFQDKRFVLQ